jgi:hypothetical protein
MAAPDAEVVERVRGIVVAAVARHTRVPPEELRLEKRLRVDPGTFYRILVDVEHQLGVHPLDGNWSFDGDSIGAVIAYYVKLMG